jgi:Mn-dependent DtxR family transcriptional regulator
MIGRYSFTVGVSAGAKAGVEITLGRGMQSVAIGSDALKELNALMSQATDTLQRLKEAGWASSAENSAHELQFSGGVLTEKSMGVAALYSRKTGLEIAVTHGTAEARIDEETLKKLNEVMSNATKVAEVLSDKGWLGAEK